MNLKSCITLVVSLLITATSTVDSVSAWQHPFHERAARISQSTLPVKYIINWNGVFMGTKDPDFRREDCPWINQSHKKDHWRIKASSDAAVKTLRNHVDPTLAGRRLGRAFHYLQDQTEVHPKTRDRFSQVFPRSQFRDTADLVLASIEHHSHGIASGPLSFSKYWRDQTREYSNYHDWSQIYDAVDNLRKGFDRKMNGAMNAAPDRGPAIEVFHWYFASLVALQNQIVRLYAKDLRDTKTFLNQLGQSQPPPRADPPLQSPPAPPPKPPPPKNIVSEQEKKVLYDEINKVYKTRWEKQWCAKAWSGCAIFPSGQKDALKWAVVYSTRREQLEAIRKRLYCYDPCVMGNYNDKQRTDCLQRCIKQFPS